MRHRFIVAAGLALASAACHGPGEDVNAFQWTNDLPAGATLHLRDGTGDIVVRRAAGQSAVVNGSRKWNHGRSSDIHFAVKQVGRDYYICAMWRNSGSCGNGAYRGRSSGGFLEMFSLFHRGSDASAGFVAEVPANVLIDAKTSNGSVEIDGISAGVTAHSSNGTVRASNVSGPLVLATTNGDVRLTTDSLLPLGAIDLSTINGSIRAALPANAQGEFDLSVVNGVVRSDFPVPSTSESRAGRHLRGQVGASTQTVRMHVVNGMVSVIRGAAGTQ